MATWETYKDREFHFRLEKLIIDGGTAVARNIFDNRLVNIPLSDFLAKGRSEIERLRAQKIILQSQYLQLYPQGGQPPNTNSKDFDLTLIICLLKNLPSLGLNKIKFRISPDQTDPPLEADLTRLNKFRNEIFHRPSTTGFDELTFETKWKEITQVLLRLNTGPHSDPTLEPTIDGYKNASLDPVAEQKYKDLFKKHIDDLAKDLIYLEVTIRELNQTKKRDTKVAETKCQDAVEQRQEQENILKKEDGDLNTESRIEQLEACFDELKDKVNERYAEVAEKKQEKILKKEDGDLNTESRIKRLEKGFTELKSKVNEILEILNRDAEDGKAPDSQVTPGDACLFDGRLIKLAVTDIDDLKKCCTKFIGKGGFGTVYASEKSLDRFGMQIAVKKCPALDGSVRREMFASRIMNPFILPLLAAEKIGEEIWFVSPYFEGGDLLLAIENDRAPKEIKMNQLTRLKILLQIAFAIQYIHTEIDTIRDVTLHKDICSKNVVLDKNYNARLIDFGLAREKNDDTSHARGAKSAYHHPGILNNDPATESWDYYAFGVVICEMLTGFHPHGHQKPQIKALKILSKEEISNHLKERTVWSSEVAQKLNNIAADCLDVTHKEWNVTNFKNEVVDKIKDICRECIILKFLDLSEDQQKRCHSCIINPVAKESSMKKDHRDNCTQKIEVCIACEKNSFLNPITCYCGTELKPCIGSGWGALLVAGNHSNDSLANAMTQDVKEMKRVITSKAPRIMGISEENVRIVVPAKPGKPLSGATPETKLRQEVMSKLRDIRQDKIDTLLVYFSCEGIKDDADEHNKTFRFKLAPEDDSISLNDFTTELNNLANVNNLIVFLDCCNAPLLSDIGKKKLLQITSCKENETAKLNDKGSTFTKYIIQGLKAKSEKTCIEKCHHCKQYWQTQDSFISAHSLFCYVKNHTGSKANTPKPDIKMMSEFPLAFYTAEPVEIDFTFEEEKTEKRVPLEYLGTMEQLEEKLLKEFGKDETVTVTIKKKTHRKKDEKKKEECSSLDQVMEAWVQRHPLYVSFQAARGQTKTF